MGTIIRIFAVYRPLQFFFLLGSILVFFGGALAVRWVLLNIYEFPRTGRLHIPSLIVAATLLLTGLQFWVLGLVADLLAANRFFLEEVRYFVRRFELTHDEARGRQAGPDNA